MASKVLSVTAQPFNGVDRQSQSPGCWSLPGTRQKSGSFPRPALPGVVSTTSLSATPTTQPTPHGVPVESHDLSPLGLPVLPVDSSYTHAIANTPAGPVETCRSLLDQRRPSPSVLQVGSRIARFEDCSAFTHVMACVFADSLKEPFPRVLQSKSLPP
jgi:hypothetical protein